MHPERNSGGFYYDKDGTPLDTLGWAMKFENRDYRQIGFDQTPNGFKISTVWIGFDVGFAMHPESHHPPMIFETRINKPDGQSVFVKYSDLVAAEYGHQAAIQIYGGLDAPED